MGDLPGILIEVVLVFGGVLAFGWWQLRTIKRDRAKAAAERAARESGGPGTHRNEAPRSLCSLPPEGALGTFGTAGRY